MITRRKANSTVIKWVGVGLNLLAPIVFGIAWFTTVNKDFKDRVA